MSAALNAIRPKLAKLVPLLSSDKPGEVAAAVAAIERTLKAGGCDWHALAAFIGDVPVPFVYTAPNPHYSRPAPTQPQPPSKPVREPSPWPTWSKLKHSEHLAWMAAIASAPHQLKSEKRFEFDELYRKLHGRPHELLSSKEISFFNRIAKVNWALGVRP